MNNVEIRPATTELLQQFYGQAMPRTVRAVVAVDGDGKVLGVGGYYVDGVRAVIFSDLSHEVRQQKRVIIKATRATLEMVRASGLSGVAQRETPESAVFLEHFGFREFMPGVYEWLS